jgi:hypothetical protein
MVSTLVAGGKIMVFHDGAIAALTDSDKMTGLTEPEVLGDFWETTYRWLPCGRQATTPLSQLETRNCALS